MNFLLLACSLAAPIQFGNDAVTATFSDSPFGSLQQIQAVNGPGLLRGGSLPSLWSATIVTSRGQSSISSSSGCKTSSSVKGNVLTMNWDGISAGISGQSVNATVVVTLQNEQFSFDLSFAMSSKAAVWDWQMSVGPAALYTTSRALENHGFGILHECGGNFHGTSTGDGCTWGPENTNEYIPTCPGGGTSGCPQYSTLSEAQSKCDAMQTCTGVTYSSGAYQLRGGTSLEPSALSENSWVITNLPVCHQGYSPPVSCGNFGNDYPQGTYQFISMYDTAHANSGLYFATHDAEGSSKHFAFNVRPESPSPSATMTISATAADAGKQSMTHKVGYPIVLAVFDGDWWDSTQVYRPWALSSATWTSKGPVEKRNDIPSWLLNTTTWVNSHWQGNDIFNTSGGDPEVVKNRVLAVNERFGLGGANLGLHWYEWDLLGYKQGSNYTDCGSEVTCGFDTHYPEYFPTRTGFADNLKQMQAQGVKVAPYINGRIFDIATKTWKNDNAVRYAAKKAYPTLDPTQSDLSTYYESYGSEAGFNVMCPHTTYWQDIISNVSGNIVQELGTNGVYIDQIAAAGPRPCWDSTHDHTLGGGSHWVTGYKQMLADVRTKVGSNAVVLTESNAEPFMEGVTIYLTLVGYGQAPFVGTRHIVNAFGAIYGGYYYSMGAEFFQQDFAPNPNVFSSKNAKMLLYGSQLGWYSLGGRDNQNPAMGIVDQLLDDQYTPEINYLRTLSNAKLRVNKWLTYGRTTRELDLKTTKTRVHAPHHPRASRDSTRVGLSYTPVDSACWLYEPDTEKSTVVCLITAVERTGSHPFTLTMDPTKYGLAAGSTKVTDLDTGVSKTYQGTVSMQSTVNPHQVVTLLFESA